MFVFYLSLKFRQIACTFDVSGHGYQTTLFEHSSIFLPLPVCLLAILETYRKPTTLLHPFCVLQTKLDIPKSVHLSQMLLVLLYLSYQFNLSLINRHEPLTWYCQKRQDIYCGIRAFCLPPSAIPESVTCKATNVHN